MKHFDVDDQGTIFLLRPLTDDARDWIDENIDPNAQWFGDAVVVEHRYIGDILVGIERDGLGPS